MFTQEFSFFFREAFPCELVNENEAQKALVVSKEDGAEVVQHPCVNHGLQGLHLEGKEIMLI